MSKIQDKDILYTLCRPYVDWRFKRSYRRISYVGRENIPTDGAIIYAPNHCNCLQDALAILSIDKKPKVFVARADIFRNKKLAKVLRWLKIMPIARQRDGVENVKKNQEIIDQCISVLCDDVPFCILPEGKHQAKHSLLPLLKGIFRIAWQANEKLQGTKPIYIVPVGLEYGSYFRFRSTLLVNIGKPINVTEFITQHAQLTQPQQFNLMMEQLTEAMQEQILYIPDDEHYEATLEGCYLGEIKELRQPTKPKSPKGFLHNRLQQDKAIAAQMLHLRKQSPEQAEALCQQLTEIATMRRRAGICIESVQSKHLYGAIFLRILLLLLTLPYFIVCSIITLPIWLTVNRLQKKMQDPAFYNSVQCGLTIVLLPICWLITTILLFVFMPKWYLALATVLALLPCNLAFHEYLRHFRLLRSDIRFLRNKPLRHKLKKLKKDKA